MQTDDIRDALRRRYAAVATQPAGQFSYPVGRESAQRSGYRADRLARLPQDVIDHFIGVGNPFSLGEPQAGEHVLDIGCGGGFDALIAAQCVGDAGQVIGVDMSAEMLAVARAGLAASGARGVRFVEGYAEALPVGTGWADFIISNGVLNLATCKATAFAEIARVLRPGGRFQAADLILVKALPPDMRDDQFAWSN